MPRCNRPRLRGGTVGPGSALYTSQAETGLSNNGYGTITGGTRPLDTDNDGMPDDWETATGSNPGANDAMTKGADGYALIEGYVNWLAGPHASTPADTSIDVDLSTYAAGFSRVSPAYAVAEARSGTIALQPDSRTARFQPGAGFRGLASFAFTVTGSDGTAYSGRVAVLVTP